MPQQASLQEERFGEGSRLPQTGIAIALLCQITQHGVIALVFSRSFVDQVKIRFAAASTLINHFLVVGDRAYRNEALHAKTEIFTDMGPKLPARVNFNDPSGARQLADAFDDMWNELS